MHDPFAWSIPLVRVFGINIRMHWLFPFVALGWVLHVALYKPVPEYKIPEGIWIDACILMLILFFGLRLRVLPIAGNDEGIKSLVLPAITLATIPLAIISRLTRSSLLEVLGQDYIRTSRVAAGFTSGTSKKIGSPTATATPLLN